MNELPADCWVPVPIRWRHIAPGDVVVVPGEDAPAALWLVTMRDRDGTVVAQRTFHERHHGQPDPDDVVHVLVPVAERDAVTLARDELGARLMERRSV